MTKSLSEVRDNLIKAKDLIADPSNWTTGAFARSIDGKPVSLDAYEACQWCAIGAVQKVCSFDGDRELSVLRKFAGKIAEFNDSGTHYKVIGLFNQAIESCQ